MTAPTADALVPGSSTAKHQLSNEAEVLPDPHPHPHPNPNPNQVETTPYAALLFNNCLDNGEP